MMFRLLVLCAILTFVEPYTSQCRTRPPFYGDRCPGVIVTNLEIMSEPFERDLIEQEQRFAQFCQENSPAMIGETYKSDNYELVYDLIEARDSKITVRIKHKFLHITATEKYGNQEIVFQDVKVLPDMVNTDAAQWTFKNGETLIIKIPYRVPIGMHETKSCPVVNDHVIDVPHAPESEFNYSLQDWTENTYEPAGRPSGSSYGSRGWTQNGFNAPPSIRPSGPNYGFQAWSQNGFNAPPPSRSSGPNYGSQGWPQNGFNAPPIRPSGSNYGSQGWPQNGRNVPASRTADPSSGFIYRSLGSVENIP